MRSKWYDYRIKFFVGLLAADVVLGTGGFMLAESIPFTDALYLCVISITTVGYGDITPVTGLGRVVAVLVVFLGVGSFTGLIALLTESLLFQKEEEFRREKLNMALSVFYSEIGTRLLILLTPSDPKSSKLDETLRISADAGEKRLKEIRALLEAHDYKIDARGVDLPEIGAFLESRSETFLRMIENPNLHNEATLTELVRAVIHLKEEIHYRGDFSKLPDSDYEHLAGDVGRVYRLLTLLWVEYIWYVKDSYPYLFSLAMRMNPFNQQRSPVVVK